MKLKYICDSCGDEFSDRDDCLRHEEKCGKPKSLEDRVAELEHVVEVLRTEIMLLRQPPVVTTPGPVPRSPYDGQWGPLVNYCKTTANASSGAGH